MIPGAFSPQNASWSRVAPDVVAFAIGTGVALFLLGFFSLHFCGFHAAHAGFLAEFFPLPGLGHRLFFDAFDNPFTRWKVVFKHLMRPYGIFLVPAIIAERRYVFRALVKAVRMVRGRRRGQGGTGSRHQETPGIERGSG